MSLTCDLLGSGLSSLSTAALACDTASECCLSFFPDQVWHTFYSELDRTGRVVADKNPLVRPEMEIGTEDIICLQGRGVLTGFFDVPLVDLQGHRITLAWQDFCAFDAEYTSIDRGPPAACPGMTVSSMFSSTFPITSSSGSCRSGASATPPLAIALDWLCTTACAQF